MDEHERRRQEDRDREQRQRDQAIQNARFDAQRDLIASTNSWDALLSLPEAMGMVPEGTLARIDAERLQAKAIRTTRAELEAGLEAHWAWAEADVPVGSEPAPTSGVVGSLVLDVPDLPLGRGLRVYLDGRLHLALPAVTGLAVPLAPRARPLAVGRHAMTVQVHATWFRVDAPLLRTEAWDFTYDHPGRFEMRVRLSDAECDTYLRDLDSGFRVHREATSDGPHPAGADLVRLWRGDRVIGTWPLGLGRLVPIDLPAGRHRFWLDALRWMKDPAEPFRLVQRFAVDREVPGPCRLIAFYDEATGGLQEGRLLVRDA